MNLLRRLLTSLALAVPTAVAMLPGISVGRALATVWGPDTPATTASGTGTPSVQGEEIDHTLRLLGWALGATVGYLSALGMLAILLVVIHDTGLERTLRATAAVLPLLGMVFIPVAALLTQHHHAHATLLLFGVCALGVLLIRLQVLRSHPHA